MVLAFTQKSFCLPGFLNYLPKTYGENNNDNHGWEITKSMRTTEEKEVSFLFTKVNG